MQMLLVLLGFGLVSVAPSIKRNLATLSGGQPAAEDCAAYCTWVRGYLRG